MIGLVVSMIKAAVANGQASNLNHLLIAIPDMYMEVVDPLCALFALQNCHFAFVRAPYCMSAYAKQAPSSIYHKSMSTYT